MHQRARRSRPIGFLAGAVLAVAAMTGSPVGFAEAAPDPIAVAQSLVEHYVLPRHHALAAATAELEATAQAFCKSPDEAKLKRLVSAFHASVDAWLGVEPLQFGPIALLMRGPRMYFWPDPTGRTARDVAEFVAAGVAADLEGARFQAAPVSLQGLPAAENLLFGETSRSHLLANDEEGQFRCVLLKGIARNVHEIAVGLVSDWESGETPFTRAVAAPGPDNPYFASQEEVTVAFLKAVNQALRLALDTRLKPVLGADIGVARPDRAEARRSGRSLRNIVAGLEAARAIYLGAGGKGLDHLAAASEKDKEIAPLLGEAFGITIDTANGIGKPLTEAVADPDTRPELEKLAIQIQALRQLVGTRLAAALNLSIGFNALDGD